MDKRLESAGNQLEAALNRYLRASFAIQKSRDGKATETHSQNLMDHIPELTLFEQRLQRTKAAVGIARNHSVLVVPIHRLSLNLLARIFREVVSSETCAVKLDGTGRFPKRSIGLSHVCNLWRQIAIASPYLWSHIDISPSILKSKTLFSRINTFLDRTGQSSLDLHIGYASEDEDEGADGLVLSNFIAPLVPRMQEVKCCIQPSWSVSERCFPPSALSCFLNEKAAPGMLTALDLSSGTTSGMFYLQTTEQMSTFNSLSLNISMHHLEELLLSVTVLRLNNICPQWTSKAFHGLVELRLHTSDRRFTIHESDLAAILAHSPTLRVFDLGIQIEFANTPMMSIALHSLEVLLTHIPSYSQLGRFLRLIDSGPSPLLLSIDSPHQDDELNDNLVHFFSHSNITRFCTAQPSKFSKSFELVNLAHTIKKLAVNHPLIDAGGSDELDSPLQVHLDTLYLLGNIYLDISQLRDMIDWTGVQKLVLWGDIYRVTHSGKPIMSKEFLKKKLSDFGVAVEIISLDLPSPMGLFLL
ncbi:hypothetical protein B0J17DRAFT_670527 [Rhizoctonia solani]|nr:hypothetical protein B0J17DRAFT_670527 [Rhizoctonia solani]